MATTSVTLFTPSSIEMTLAELQTSQSNETLPAGKWVLVTDICDEGGWLFCSSSSQVAQNGFGLFLIQIGTIITPDTCYISIVTGICRSIPVNRRLQMQR